MNFQELMSRATQNSNNAVKQKKRSGHQHKDDSPQVSNSAVHSFLAKKRQEEKKRQADEEAARRARIEARIEQNLQQQKKGGKKGKPSDETESSLSNPQCSSKQEKPVTKKAKQQQQQQPREHEKKRTKPIKTASCSSMPDRPSIKPSMEKNAEQRKEKPSEKKKKSKVKPPPPNFKELLEMAERNRLGLGNNKPKNDKNNAKSSKMSKVDKKTVKDKLKEEPQKAVVRPQQSVKKKESKHLAKTKLSEPTSSKIDKELKSVRKPDKIKPSTRDIVQNRPPLKRPNPYDLPTPRQQRMHRPKRQYTGYHDDEEEEDDMDGFIDDEEFETGGDVSAHIREIFGYDRHRFVEDDLDDATMESSYSQIEREEHRSSKIAKLEDEIAFLKEQAELKREKDRLMKGKKKPSK